MRASILACLVLLALALGDSAAATSDGGYHAALVAVGGPQQRYAIVRYESIQEECYAGCKIFVVDTRATTFKRLHVATVKHDADLLGAYLDTLPASFRARLHPVMEDVDLLPHLTLDTAASKPNDLVYVHDGRTLHVRLEHLWTSPSMQGLDKVHADRMLSCMDWTKPEPTCSSCRRVTRWANGEKNTTWACSGKGQFPDGYAEDTRDCDCSAEAKMTALTSSWAGTAVQRRGAQLLVEPIRLQQHRATGGSTEVTLAATFDDDEVTHASIEAIVLEKSVLVLGAAVHGRYVNGTYMPLVGSIPRLPAR